MIPNSSLLMAGHSNVKFTEKEQELFEIFLEEYNDIFPNILNLSERAIFDRIILNVTTLIGEKNLNSFSKVTVAKIQSVLKTQHYLSDLLASKQIREIILSMGTKDNSNRFPPLDINKIIPHCEKTSKCYHTCGNELLYPIGLNYIICLNCKKIFKPSQIHLLCKECNEDYYADIYIEEEKNEDFVRATWDHYHCKNYFPEDMKCPKCKEGIFFSPKKKIYKCFNCKWENKIKTMIWNCKVCGKDFFSGVTSYIKYELKPDKISYIQTLINKTPAKPNYIPCCNIDPRNVEFKHNIDCDGTLYLGINQGKKIIVCSKCKDILDYNKMFWYCPRCGENFICSQKKINRISTGIKINEKDNDKGFNSDQKYNKYISSISLSESKNNKNENSNIMHNNSINPKKNFGDIFLKELKQLKQENSIKKAPTNLFKEDKNVNVNLNVNININNIYKNYNNNNNIKKIKNNEFPIKKSYTTIIEPNEDFNHKDFKRNQLIGEGTFGKIYSATWNINNLSYALKELIFHSKEEIKEIRVEYDLILSFYKKTQCSGIIKVYGAQSEKENDGNYHFYVLMEIATSDWEKEIKKRGRTKNLYTEGELLSIAKRLIRTFALLEKYGISHRDIKPQNVLIIDNDYKICDFGEAKITNKNISEIHTLRGTELYMSPLLFKALKEKKNEVFHNVFKSDVFSLGMCMTLAASLNFKTLCEIREVNEMDKIKNILVKYLISKYSFEFIKILLMMLENDENKRPDFIQLEEKIRD